MQITAKLRAHVAEHDLGREDLLFEMPVEERPRVRVPRLDADLDALGRTERRAAIASPAAMACGHARLNLAESRRPCSYPGWEAREQARYRADAAADAPMKLPADSG